MSTTLNHPPETIDAYLAELRRALAGCKPALIADALADCEEHLRNEMASNPGRSERDVLGDVVATYGTPVEIAEEYRAMEASIAGPFPKPEVPKRRHGGFFNIVSEPTVYGALLYMLLSLVTGVFYFCWVTVGLSLSLAFSILIIGVPFALLFIGSVRVLSLVEGRIVESLLGVRMPRRMPPATSETGIIARIKEAVTDLRTWSSMLYLLLMLPLGVAYFTVTITGLALSLGLAGGAMWGLITGESHIQIDDVPWLDHLMHTAPGLILAVLVGGLLFLMLLYVVKGLGWLHGRVAETLLVRL